MPRSLTSLEIVEARVFGETMSRNRPGLLLFPIVRCVCEAPEALS
jgi:hypothetical protein